MSPSCSITDYPEYDEIVNQYYNGMVLNWSTEDFREHNLCYLAGYETGVAQIGYCADQTIANEGSSGAALSIWGYYDFVSGQLQLKEGIFTDGDKHPENPYFYTTTTFYEDYSNPISEEEAENIINKYTYETIPYISLADINNQSAVVESGTSSFWQQAEQEVNETEQQASVAESGNEQYEIWDRCLNDVWGYLQEALSSEEMETLIQEEMD